MILVGMENNRINESLWYVKCRDVRGGNWREYPRYFVLFCRLVNFDLLLIWNSGFLDSRIFG